MSGTLSRVFGHVDAEAFNAALHGYLTAMPASPPGALPAVTRHEREQRRGAAAAARPDPPGLPPATWSGTSTRTT